MALTDNKTFGWNINWKQAVGLAVILVVVFLAIHFDSLIIGYTAMTLVLCAFFLIVAFDVGVPPRPSSSSEGDAEPRPSREG